MFPHNHVKEVRETFACIEYVRLVVMVDTGPYCDQDDLGTGTCMQRFELAS